MVAGRTCRTNSYLSQTGGNSLLSHKWLLCLKEFISEFSNSPCVCVCVCVCVSEKIVCVCVRMSEKTSRLLRLWVTAVCVCERETDGPLLVASSPHLSMTFVSITVWLNKSPGAQTTSMAVAELLS